MIENGWREEDLWDIWGGGNWERGKLLDSKQRIQNIYIKKSKWGIVLNTMAQRQLSKQKTDIGDTKREN